MLSGDKLHFLRIYHNITQKQMASGIGKSDRWVRMVETGSEVPTEEVYQAWLDTCYSGKENITKKSVK